MKRTAANAQPAKEEPKIETAPVVESEEKSPDAESAANAQPAKEEPSGNGGILGDGSNTIMTIGERTDGHNLVISSANVVTSMDPADLHPGLIKVSINYPSDWSKPKFFKDGDVKLCSKETADSFVSMGIGTIQTD